VAGSRADALGGCSLEMQHGGCGRPPGRMVRSGEQKNGSLGEVSNSRRGSSRGPAVQPNSEAVRMICTMVESPTV
jgi:hypothetical protein